MNAAELLLQGCTIYENIIEITIWQSAISKSEKLLILTEVKKT